VKFGENFHLGNVLKNMANLLRREPILFELKKYLNKLMDA